MQSSAFRGWRVTLSWAAMLCGLQGNSFQAAGGELAPEIGRSLSLLAKSAQIYTEQRTCFSCHHQTLPVLALQQAHDQGFKVPMEEIQRQLSFTQRFFADRRAQVALGKDVPGGPFTAGYALLMLGENRWARDKTTDAMVQYLTRHQAEEGSWWIVPHRHPMEQSLFAATALSLRGLQLYALTSESPQAIRDEVQSRIERARQWLGTTPVKTHEDKVFRLWGLTWSGAAAPRRSQLGAELLKEQRSDGGWSQLKAMESDAYATGQALVVLHKTAALDVCSVGYRRGIAYLRKTQKKDGSWLVETRCDPVQEYFESGFPHQASQFISIAATSWATRALLYADLGTKAASSKGRPEDR